MIYKFINYEKYIKIWVNNFHLCVTDNFNLFFLRSGYHRVYSGLKGTWRYRVYSGIIWNLEIQGL